ncbi:ABC transporter ATP-binding protein [Aquabacterium sp. CECT 9606]|uniref:ABC transporter ATP-binding protein n=1 Tax=Aquabacterium sp. CECT 9606 TaxID=2845822 RepID=UPI001E34A684|nr:ABC transporter transmembrane domain-containing protein [Aquabacterium sp. CECT 9606]CAH0354116.1 Lipid A export ATP-binding/permease protein MsbA [Aquabacterium sp. CECT 9606]
MDYKDASQRLLSYARPQWRMLSTALLFFILGSAVEPILPAMFKKLIDSGFKEGMDYPLWAVPVVVIGLFIIRGVFNFGGAYVMNSATSTMVLNLRRDLMRALLKADAHLFTTISPGLAVSKIINDPQHASTAMGGAIVSIVRDASTLLFLVAYLIYLNPELTLISFISMPLLGISVKLVRKRLAKVGEAAYLAQQSLVGTVDDNARAWRVVRTFDATEFELRRFEQQAIHHRRMTMKQVAASSMVTPITQIVAAIGVSIILTLALYQAQNGASTVGEFVSFITALLMTMSPMRHLTDVFQPITGALITARGAFELINAPPEPDLGTAEMPVCHGKIDFNNVYLHYEGASNPALAGLNLSMKAGQTIALVGSSGAGKSTVVNTLLRFAYPTSGQILLDDTPIDTLKLASLRRHFAVVSQDIVLFEGSIAQNVAYASPHGLDRAKVENCLKAANLWNHVLTLPEGMDAAVGTNGSRLSGGQRQRLAIARALYRDAAVWIFDEATSALDSESEAVVQRSIEDLRGSKTLILIAHRLSTIRNADCIYVMSEGKVVEQGTHTELIARQGLYAGMVKIQTAD